MVREFWGHRRWRLDRWIWGSALAVIAVIQLFTRQSPLGILLLLLLAGLCFISAWRRSTAPLYTVTDDELLFGQVWHGRKRILWHDIKQICQDEYGVRLIGREWFGGTSLSLMGLPRTDRDVFLELVRAKVDEANAEDEKNG